MSTDILELFSSRITTSTRCGSISTTVVYIVHKSHGCMIVGVDLFPWKGRKALLQLANPLQVRENRH